MKFLRFWFPVISYSAMIFYVSGLSNLDIGFGISYFDKFLHVGEYAILGFLFARALKGTRKTIFFPEVMGITLLFISIFGIADEWHQMLVPGRDASSADVLSDGVGGMLGSFLYLIIRKRVKSWHK